MTSPGGSSDDDNSNDSHSSGIPSPGEEKEASQPDRDGPQTAAATSTAATQPSDDDLRVRRAERRRELNRLSKTRCRKRKGEHAQLLQAEFNRLTAEYNALKKENTELRQEYTESLNQQRQGTGTLAVNSPHIVSRRSSGPNEVVGARAVQQHLFNYQNHAGIRNVGSMEDSQAYAGWISQALLRQHQENRIRSMQDNHNVLHFLSPFHLLTQQAHTGTLANIPPNPLLHASNLLPWLTAPQRDPYAEAEFLARRARVDTINATAAPRSDGGSHELFPSFSIYPQANITTGESTTSDYQSLKTDSFSAHVGTVHDEVATHAVQPIKFGSSEVQLSASEQSGDNQAERVVATPRNNADFGQKRRAR